MYGKYAIACLLLLRLSLGCSPRDKGLLKFLLPGGNQFFCNAHVLIILGALLFLGKQLDFKGKLLMQNKTLNGFFNGTGGNMLLSLSCI